ncbi:Ser/Thr protein phosphatase family protein [Pelomyxa schiedti]|nr:Ser/Thr protein phosphatase family protein [Pelomyxa schiedti]
MTEESSSPVWSIISTVFGIFRRGSGKQQSSSSGTTTPNPAQKTSVTDTPTPSTSTPITNTNTTTAVDSAGDTTPSKTTPTRTTIPAFDRTQSGLLPSFGTYPKSPAEKSSGSTVLQAQYTPTEIPVSGQVECLTKKVLTLGPRSPLQTARQEKTPVTPRKGSHVFQTAAKQTNVADDENNRDTEKLAGRKRQAEPILNPPSEVLDSPAAPDSKKPSICKTSIGTPRAHAAPKLDNLAMGSWDQYSPTCIDIKTALFQTHIYWLTAATKLLKTRNLLNEITLTGTDSHINIVGDLHGNLECLTKAISAGGVPSETNKWLFNGDFIDRGAFGMDVLTTLCEMLVTHPGQVFMNRGNHECTFISAGYGHSKCLQAVFGPIMAHSLWDKCVDLYKELPLASVISFQSSRGIFVTHGGIGPNVTMTAIQNSPRWENSVSSDLLKELLWNSPSDKPGMTASVREGFQCWGPDITDQFLQDNHLCCIIRSHDAYPHGIQYTHNNKVITVFSSAEQSADPCFCRIAATNFNEVMPIKGAAATMDKLEQVLFHQQQPEAP